MKIILKAFVDNLGDAGDTVDVANGYANNYLIPQNLAMRATKGAVADAEALRRSRLKREAVEIADAEEVKKGLEGRTLVITATAGEDGTLYGSVGKRDVAEAVVSTTGVQVDHKKIVLDRALKEVGQHEVGVKLHREVIATVIVDIVADEIIESGDLESALEDADNDTEAPEVPAGDADADEAEVDAAVAASADA